MNAVTLPQDEDELVRWAEGQVQKAKQWFPAEWARVVAKRARAGTRIDSAPATTKAAAGPESVSALRQEYERDAVESFANEPRVLALMHFADTERGRQMNRRIEMAMRHEHEQRMKGETKKMTTSDIRCGTRAADLVVERAQQRVAKSGHTISLEKAVDLEYREHPELYREHLAEIRPPTPGPSPALTELTRLANEAVTKRARPLRSAHDRAAEFAKAFSEVVLAHPDLYAEYRAGR